MISFCVSGLVYCAFFGPSARCFWSAGSPRALNSWIALKLPLLQPRGWELASRCPRTAMFCCPHKTMQSIIASSRLQLSWYSSCLRLSSAVSIVGWVPEWASMKLVIAEADLMCVEEVEGTLTFLFSVVQVRTGFWTKLWALSLSGLKRQHSKHRHPSSWTEYPSHLCNCK